MCTIYNGHTIKLTIFFCFYFSSTQIQIEMEAPEFRDFAKEMVDYIANYLENIRDRYVTNSLKIIAK